MFLDKGPASCYCNPEVRHVHKRKGRLCSDLLLICVNILHFIISPSLSQLKCCLGINTAPALRKNWNLHIWTSQEVFPLLLPCARRVCCHMDNLIPYTINTWPDGPEWPLCSFTTDWIHSVESKQSLSPYSGIHIVPISCFAFIYMCVIFFFCWKYSSVTTVWSLVLLMSEEREMWKDSSLPVLSLQLTVLK